jgi:hypothetical protein
MPILTEEEAYAFDKILTDTTPEANPNVEGPFIKNRRRGMMVALDRFSADCLQSRMLATKQTPSELINEIIREKLVEAEAAVL